MKWRILALAAALVGAAAGASAQTGGETQAQFMARCQREVVQQWPSARAQAQSICQSRWEEATAAGPLADTLIAMAPAPGAAFNPVTARAAATQVRWTNATTGRLSGGSIALTRTPVLGAAYSWYASGEPIPFALQEALRIRGVTLAIIGCLSYGASESTEVHRVTMAGKAPFALTIERRNAAVASQSSEYIVTADYSGRFPTLATLRRDGDDWAPRCPN